MNPNETVALANLLSVLLPLGIQTYTQIQKAHSDQLKPIDEILSGADANWDAVIATAKAELSKP